MLTAVSACRASKYHELQEAWDQAGTHSVLTVPIPAVRAYESASIPEAPENVEETACDPASHVCQVLHNLNGTVGIMTIGLSTEEIDLHGRYVSRVLHGYHFNLPGGILSYAE